MRECDCLIIGHNDFDFEEYVKLLESIGTDHADYRDLNLNFIRYNGKSYRALDILTHFYYEGKTGLRKPFHNSETLWMVITYLGTYLSKRGFSFDYINLFQLEKDKLIEKLKTTRYLTIVVTTTILNYENPILEVMEFVRKYDDTAKIVVGGPYISKRSERMEPGDLRSLFKYIGADFYVYCREGEEALVNIIRALKDKRGFDSIPNIAYRKKNESKNHIENDYVVTPAALELNSLEQNMIDYSLFPKEDIGGFVNLRFSKGCPYRCSFCGFPHRTVKYMYNSAEYVKKELDAVREIGTVDRLHFTDDTVNVPLKRFKEILRIMIKERYGFKWDCYFRCDHVDEEAVELMRDSGCEGVFLGLESANETILKNMNKTAGKEPYRKFVPLFREAGIATFMSVFIGFPGETVETFKETMDFLEETRADFYRPQLWYCDPMTPIWKQREKYGLKGYNFAWSHNTMDAKTACDLLEEACLTLDAPVWVPDPGYNYISVYLMKQRGISIEKQKTFLACFNAVVKEKLLYPGKKEISPGLLESLKRSCKFDEPVEPDMKPVLEFSSEGFIAAEKYWNEEFGKGNEKEQEQDMGIGPGERKRNVSGSIVIGKDTVEKLKTIYGKDLSTVVLPAFATLLLKLNGREDISLAAGLDGNEPFPLRLYPLWTLSFGEFVHTSQVKIRQAMEHRKYGFYILEHPVWTLRHADTKPVFKYGYQVTEDGNESKKENENAIRRNPELTLEVIYGIENENDGLSIRFISDPFKYSPETVYKLTDYMVSILESVKENNDIRLNEIILDPEAGNRKQVVEVLAGKDFNF